ncbi:uncharacterized protein TNIN_201611 [Trichonephila inaurata madagascariensis]|uniref:Gustatory receptor n=1 Tax=Trichonephila inaurata madagascariensis TaxID=2747483 RepID=A0A8X6YY03_9ARAC|nr:uncharacterized protein TNIN_201611 [Trichonephila inaurata madagascariensis]
MLLLLLTDSRFASRLLVENIVCLSSNILLMYLMTQQKQRFTNLLKILQSLCPLEWTLKMNIAIICICCLPFTYAFMVVLANINSSDDFMFKFLCYGIVVENKTFKYLIAYYKCLLYYILHPTLTNVVSLTYCIFCLICSTFLQNLSSDIQKCPPMEFSTKVQIGFLKSRYRIIAVLEEIQAVFSKASLVICIGNFMACFSNLGEVLYYSPKTAFLTAVEVMFISTSTLVSLLSIFYCAGRIPLEMNAFSRVMQKQFEKRTFLGVIEENTSVERLLFQEKIFVLSGCEMIHFTRSGILTILGAILTYGLLILSVDLKDVNH